MAGGRLSEYAALLPNQCRQVLLRTYYYVFVYLSLSVSEAKVKVLH